MIEFSIIQFTECMTGRRYTILCFRIFRRTKRSKEAAVVEISPEYLRSIGPK